MIATSSAVRLMEAGYSVTVNAKSLRIPHAAASWFIPDLTYGTGHGSNAQGFHGELYQRWARTTEVMSTDTAGEEGMTTSLVEACASHRKRRTEGMGPIVSDLSRQLRASVVAKATKRGRASTSRWDGCLGGDYGPRRWTAFETLCTTCPNTAHLRGGSAKAAASLSRTTSRHWRTRRVGLQGFLHRQLRGLR